MRRRETGRLALRRSIGGRARAAGKRRLKGRGSGPASMAEQNGALRHLIAWTVEGKAFKPRVADDGAIRIKQDTPIAVFFC